MNLNFKKFNTGTLFLVRTPEVFPVGYADKSFRDMKENLHFDYAALLETWNCVDGTVWISDKFPRSSFWKGEERDPLEECFAAADKYGMAFLPEAGMMDDAYMHAHEDGMRTDEAGNKYRYGRIGLVPSCPLTLEYLIAKYDALLEKFGHHPSCRGVCLPCENGIDITYDRYTQAAYRERFDRDIPSMNEMYADSELEDTTMRFLEEQFLTMYRALARHIKEKWNLPLMHYPLDIISAASFMQPARICSARNITVMTSVPELDLLNMQLHPPVFPNPYFFKLETEYLMANCEGMPCMADTHFYHEGAAGRVPDMTPKRNIDSILSTVTPYGISFFCYGFMAEELPLWKKELNPQAPVFRAYAEKHTVAARREACLTAMDYVEKLRPMLENTHHSADVAIYFPEELNNDYLYSSYSTEHIFGLHEMLNAVSVPVKITARVPSSKNEQKALIMDSVKSLPDFDAENLKKYLASGGKLIIIGKCCDTIEKIAGISSRLTEAKTVCSPKSTYYNNCMFRLPVDGKHYTEENGKALYYYDNKESAITRLGNVIFFGAADAVGRFSSYRDFRLAEFWQNLLHEEEIDSGVLFTNVYTGRPGGHQFTSCDIFENENKRLLLIRNFGVEHYHASVKWQLGEDMKITKAYADGAEFAYNADSELPLFEHFVAIFAEKES